MVDWSEQGDWQGLRGMHGFARLPEVSLEILRGAAQHRRRLVRPPVFLIGSAADCDLVLGDRSFPAIHTYLYVTGAGVSARHIGEGSQLALNGFLVETARLADGDRLQMGPYEFLLHIKNRSGRDQDQPSLPAAPPTPMLENWDTAWAEAQLLLCDLPAPLKPLSVPSVPYAAPRRAIA